MDDPRHLDLMSMTVEIISAYVARNAVRASDLPDMIGSLHKALGSLGSTPEPAAPEKQEPAVPIRKSVTDEFIISLEDGRKLRSMKRYLSALGMSPEQYRAKWGLPKDYPMVAPGYAKKRSELAKSIGLGRKNVTSETAPAEPPAKRQGRPRGS